MVKLIQRHELVSDYEPSKITAEDYDAFIRRVNSIITDNKDKGIVKIVITGQTTVDETTIPDGKFFPFPDGVFESVYKRFKKDLKKTDYDVTSYSSTVGVYFAVFDIEWT